METVTGHSGRFGVGALTSRYLLKEKPLGHFSTTCGEIQIFDRPVASPGTCHPILEE